MVEESAMPRLLSGRFVSPTLLLFSVKFVSGTLGCHSGCNRLFVFLSLSLTGLGFEGEMSLIGLDA